MGVLRWLFGSHRSDDEEDDEERAEDWKRGKKGRRAESDGSSYRVHLDGESQAMRGEGPPFSFWSSARIILILSFLLWWIQPAGPMIAGYVGGRRSGSAMKGVLAALLPVAVVLIANTAYTRGVGNSQIDLVASLPQAFAGGAASVLPFLMPYKEFLIGYMTGFVKALQSTFGMGTNGYLMVLIFAYIGGLIADQTRRELYYKSGSSQSVGFNLIQPLFGGRHPAVEADYEEDDEELRQMRRPVRARARGHGQVEIHTGPRRRRHHGSPNRFEDYRKLGADGYEDRRPRHAAVARARDEEDEEEDEDVSRSHRAPHAGARDHARAHAAREEDEEEPDEGAVERRKAQEARHAAPRSHEEEVRIQRFVERALRNYDHAAR